MTRRTWGRCGLGLCVGGIGIGLFGVASTLFGTFGNKSRGRGCTGEDGWRNIISTVDVPCVSSWTGTTSAHGTYTGTNNGCHSLARSN